MIVLKSSLYLVLIYLTMSVGFSAFVGVVPTMYYNMTGYIPYSGATKNVDIGVYNISASNLCNSTACYSVSDFLFDSNYNATYDLTSTRVNQPVLTTSSPTFENITVETINGTFETGASFDTTLIRLQHATNINNYLESFGESYFLLGANVYYDGSEEIYKTEKESKAHAAIRMQTEGSANIYMMLSDANAVDLYNKVHVSTDGLKVLQKDDNTDYVNLNADDLGGTITTGDELTLTPSTNLNLNGTKININEASGFQINDTDSRASVFSINAAGNTNIWNGTRLYLYSAGNDKNIQIYHDDTNAVIETSSGNITLNPSTSALDLGFGGMGTVPTIYATATGTGDSNGRLDIMSNTMSSNGAGIILYGPSYTGRSGRIELVTYGTTNGETLFTNYASGAWTTNLVIEPDGQLRSDTGAVEINDELEIYGGLGLQGGIIAAKDDTNYEYFNFQSGSTREAFFIWDSDYCTASGDHNLFCLTSDNNHDLALKAAGSGQLYLLGADVMSSSIYGDTSASAANVYIGSDGHLYRSTSSLKYKTNVTDLETDSSLIYELRPVSYTPLTEETGINRTFGLIAEEVEELIPELVQHNLDGEPEGVDYARITVLLIEEITNLRAVLISICEDNPELSGCEELI